MRLAVLLFLLAAAPLHAQDDGARARFKKELESVYNYLPADVEQKVRDAKVAEMDRFWKLVGDDTKTYLPLLREALRDPKQNRYFLFDGSALLTKHSQAKDDLALAVDAFSRCRLKDLSHKGIFYFTHRLGKLGADSTPNVLRFLEVPKLSVYVVEHALRLDLPNCMLFCVAVLPEELWVGPFIRKLATAKNKSALLSCLWYANTPASDAILAKYAADKTFPEHAELAAMLEHDKATAGTLPKRKLTLTRAKFLELLADFEKKGQVLWDEAQMREAPYCVAGEDLARLRKLRRKSARRVTDEAIYELMLWHQLITRARVLGDKK